MSKAALETREKGVTGFNAGPGVGKHRMRSRPRGTVPLARCVSYTSNRKHRLVAELEGSIGDDELPLIEALLPTLEKTLALHTMRSMRTCSRNCAPQRNDRGTGSGKPGGRFDISFSRFRVH